MAISACPSEPAQAPIIRQARLRRLATEANGQPAFAVYQREPDGSWRAFQLQVMAVSGGSISHVTAFFDLSLFPTFGLPARLDDDAALGVAVA